MFTIGRNRRVERCISHGDGGCGWINIIAGGERKAGPSHICAPLPEPKPRFTTAHFKIYVIGESSSDKDYAHGLHQNSCTVSMCGNESF